MQIPFRNKDLFAANIFSQQRSLRCKYISMQIHFCSKHLFAANTFYQPLHCKYHFAARTSSLQIHFRSKDFFAANKFSQQRTLRSKYTSMLIHLAKTSAKTSLKLFCRLKLIRTTNKSCLCCCMFNNVEGDIVEEVNALGYL